MPLTPYTTNIPLATQPINQTQQAINDNFTCLVNNAAPANGLITVNHVGTNDPIDYGKHKFIEFPVQSAAPATTTTELALYTKSVSGTPQLFLRRENNGAEINLTSATLAVNGTTTLPSGLVLKWGQTTGGAVLGNQWNAIAFPVAFTNNCFNVSVTSKATTPPPSNAQTTCLMIINSNFDKNGFQVFNRRTDIGAGINSDICWFAIGN